MSDVSDAIDAAILATVAGPSEVSVDGQTMKTHRLKDLLDAQAALPTTAPTGPRRGLRFSKMIPGGTA